MKRGAWYLAIALSIAVAAIANLAWAHGDTDLDQGKDKKQSASNKKGGDAPAESKSSGDEKPFADVIKDMEEIKGLFTFYRRAEDNKIYMEVAPGQLDQVLLFAGSVDQSTGEKGNYGAQQLWDGAFVLHRVGKSIQLIQKNTSFVADSGTPQARAVARSFANPILASAKIQSKPHSDRKSVLIDAQDLFGSKDLPGFAAALSQDYSPTSYSFDRDRSGISGVKAFPENIILNVLLHYQTENFKGTSTTLVDGRSIPITVRYSLSSIPKTTYVPRMADDRVGHFLVVRQDFTSDKQMTPYTRYVTRWNLEKQDPSAALSPPKQPIVYWLENTIPLEYRDAVRDGALLWNKAFEKVGIKDAVVVKQMPDSADWDPADVRYNTIRWFSGVDATFAIGPSRANPFTGEIYDADISISEGIVRGARRLGEEYAGPVAPPSRGRSALAWAKDPRNECAYAEGLADQASLGVTMLEARGSLSPEVEQQLMHEYIVELVAHEVGHTLGLRHNFHASTMLKEPDLLDDQKGETLGQSGSVMDYNPVIIAGKGEKQGHFVPITLGPYDYWAIEYAYTTLPSGDEHAALASIASRCADPALSYGTDEDVLGTYSPLAVDPLVNQYDQSTDPLLYFKKRVELVNELWANMEARLAKPGDGYQIMRRAVSRGLNDDYRSLVTSSKFVGGVYVHRDHVGDPSGRTPFEPVPAAKQREALAFLGKYAFGEKAFQLSPSLLNRLAVERNPGLDPAYWNVVRIDYPWHDNVMRVQKTLLDRLYHPVTLGRILDNELRFANSESTFRMADLFSGLNASIWSELDTPGTTTISSLRRNLQREQMRTLIRIALRDGTTMVDAGGGPVPVPYPEDATTLARYSLTRIQAKARAKLAGKAALDPTTRAHLQETLARIDGALTAQVTRRID